MLEISADAFQAVDFDELLVSLRRPREYRFQHLQKYSQRTISSQNVRGDYNKHDLHALMQSIEEKERKAREIQTTLRARNVQKFAKLDKGTSKVHSKTATEHEIVHQRPHHIKHATIHELKALEKAIRKASISQLPKKSNSGVKPASRKVSWQSIVTVYEPLVEIELGKADCAVGGLDEVPKNEVDVMAETKEATVSEESKGILLDGEATAEDPDVEAAPSQIDVVCEENQCQATSLETSTKPSPEDISQAVVNTNHHTRKDDITAAPKNLQVPNLIQTETNAEENCHTPDPYHEKLEEPTIPDLRPVSKANYKYSDLINSTISRAELASSSRETSISDIISLTQASSISHADLLRVTQHLSSTSLQQSYNAQFPSTEDGGRGPRRVLLNRLRSQNLPGPSIWPSIRHRARGQRRTFSKYRSQKSSISQSHVLRGVSGTNLMKMSTRVLFSSDELQFRCHVPSKKGKLKWFRRFIGL